jgi:hypothetical protein
MEEQFVIEAIEGRGSYRGYLALNMDGTASLTQSNYVATRMSLASAWCVLRFACQDAPLFPRYDLLIVKAPA